MKKNRIWAWFWIVIGVLYFVVPLIATFDFSMRELKGQYTFASYANVFNDPLFLKTFLFSVEMGILTILVSLVLVVPTAYWIRIRLPQLRVVIEFVSMMPFVIPAIVLVFGLIRVFAGPPFHLTDTNAGTYVLLVAGYTVLAMPYMFRAVDNGLSSIDVRSLTEAAQSLGAGWFTIMFKVIFPNLRVALLSGAFLTLATVMGEFTIASFLVGINAFGPYISLIGQNKTYESSSLAIISFLLTWAMMGLIQLFTRGDTRSLTNAR